MAPVRKTASVSPSTVTRFSKGEVGATRSTRRKGKPRLFAVEGDYAVRIDPRIMKHLHDTDVDFRCVEVISATEVIVHNQRLR